MYEYQSQFLKMNFSSYKENYFCLASAENDRKRRRTSVVNPDPLDPYIFGPNGSGSVNISTDPDPSFNKQEKQEKTLISTILQSNKQKNFDKKLIFPCNLVSH
jgi:hypothetical protein